MEAEKHRDVKTDERHCANHFGKKIKFYCRTHSAFVCSECLLAEHLGNGHDIVPARPLILGGVVSKDIIKTKESVSSLKSKAETHMKTIEVAHAKDTELIGLVHIKLIEDIQKAVTRYHTDNSTELEKIRHAHKQLIESLEKEEGSIKGLETSLLGQNGEATEEEFQSSVRLTDWAKKEGIALVKREESDSKNLLNHKQLLEEVTFIARDLKSKDLNQKDAEGSQEEEKQETFVVETKYKNQTYMLKGMGFTDDQAIALAIAQSNGSAEGAATILLDKAAAAKKQGGSRDLSIEDIVRAL